MVITERDKMIIKEVSRWRVMLGRQLKILGGFTGTRATDIRLKKLIDNCYLERKKYIYGIAGIYKITPLSKRLFNLDSYINKVRIEQLEHDIAVVDTYLYFKEKLGIISSDVKSEKELRSEQGFTTRGHVPDFVINHQGKKYAVEVELTLKSKERFHKNVKDNYINYDRQIWIVEKEELRIIKLLEYFQSSYNNIEIIFLESLKNLKEEQSV